MNFQLKILRQKKSRHVHLMDIGRSRTISSPGLGQGTWKEVDAANSNNENLRLSQRKPMPERLVERFRLAMKALRWEDLTALEEGVARDDGLTVRIEGQAAGGRTVRRVYLTDQLQEELGRGYTIGWVCDADTECCKLCSAKWSWLTLRHHCRACGELVCSSCSPHFIKQATLQEDGGSRCCNKCFYGPRQSNSVDGGARCRAASSGATTLEDCSPKQRYQESLAPLEAQAQVDLEEAIQRFETIQAPKNREAYALMRRFVPPDITRSSVSKMVGEGLPEAIAQRLWRCRSLWLVCLAAEDIAKIHIADLRSKYDWHGLDIVEMRAVYYKMEQIQWDRTVSNSSVKAEWRDNLKTKLDELAHKETAGSLSANERRNAAYVDCGIDADGGEQEAGVYDCGVEILPRYSNGAASWRTSAADSPVPVSSSRRSGAGMTVSGVPAAPVSSAERLQLERKIDEEIASWLPPSPEALSFDTEALSPMPPAVLTPRPDAVMPLHRSPAFHLSPARTPHMLVLQQRSDVRHGSLCALPTSTTGKDLGVSPLPAATASDGAKSLSPLPAAGRLSLSPTPAGSWRRGKGEGICRTVIPFNNSSETSELLQLTSAGQYGLEEPTEAKANPQTEEPQVQVEEQTASQVVVSTQRLAAQLLGCMLGGHATQARALLAQGVTIDASRATTALLHCADDPDGLEDAAATISLLIELDADVDATDEDGRTALMALCYNAELGGLLVMAGADVLRDDSEGCNALQTSLEYGIEWLLDTFVACGREEALLRDGSDDTKRKYAAVLLFGGYGPKVQALLEAQRVPLIEADEAAELLPICQTNIAEWKYPCETYELFESLGAQWC